MDVGVFIFVIDVGVVVLGVLVAVVLRIGVGGIRVFYVIVVFYFDFEGVIYV